MAAGGVTSVQVPRVTIAPSFKKQLRKKSPTLKKAIFRCLRLLESNPRHPGLKVHRIRGTADEVWEAYVDRKNRVTFRREDAGGFVMLNHCNHDIIRDAARR